MATMSITACMSLRSAHNLYWNLDRRRIDVNKPWSAVRIADGGFNVEGFA